MFGKPDTSPGVLAKVLDLVLIPRVHISHLHHPFSWHTPLPSTKDVDRGMMAAPTVCCKAQASVPSSHLSMHPSIFYHLCSTLSFVPPLPLLSFGPPSCTSRLSPLWGGVGGKRVHKFDNPGMKCHRVAPSLSYMTPPFDPRNRRDTPEARFQAATWTATSSSFAGTLSCCPESRWTLQAMRPARHRRSRTEKLVTK